MGVAGSVTIHVNAGYTEPVIPGGLKLFKVLGSSSTNQIIFKKNGAGANPLLIAHTGTATPSSGQQDGVWCLAGADYITIDGIDIYDPNTTNPATMEYGYGLHNFNNGNGC